MEQHHQSTDPVDSKMKMKYYEQLNVHKFENLDQFFAGHNLLTLAQLNT
jgi:hypothetical protein